MGDHSTYQETLRWPICSDEPCPPVPRSSFCFSLETCLWGLYLLDCIKQSDFFLSPWTMEVLADRLLQALLCRLFGVCSVHRNRRVCMRSRVFGGQRTAQVPPFGSRPPWFLRQIRSLPRSWTSGWDWLWREPLGSACICLLYSVITSTCRDTRFQCTGSGWP